MMGIKMITEVAILTAKETSLAGHVRIESLGLRQLVVRSVGME